MGIFKPTLALAALAIVLGLASGKATEDSAGPITPEVMPCNPNECKEVGDCFKYSICSDGAWKNETCPSGLYWDPNALNLHGGTCNYWANLGEDIKNKYANDPNCIPPCTWWQDESQKCGPYYYYRKPFDTSFPLTAEQRNVLSTCPSAPPNSGKPNLMWNQAKLTCDHLQNILGCTGIIDPAEST